MLIHAKPGREQEARDALTHAIATTAKPGMVSGEIFADEHDPDAFYSTQLWDNADSSKAHMGEVRGGMQAHALAGLRWLVKDEALREPLLRAAGRAGAARQDQRSSWSMVRPTSLRMPRRVPLATSRLPCTGTVVPRPSGWRMMW